MSVFLAQGAVDFWPPTEDGVHLPAVAVYAAVAVPLPEGCCVQLVPHAAVAQPLPGHYDALPGLRVVAVYAAELPLQGRCVQRGLCVAVLKAVQQPRCYGRLKQQHAPGE